jgi:flagella basal body P-ring formation protein FlgA
MKFMSNSVVIVGFLMLAGWGGGVLGGESVQTLSMKSYVTVSESPITLDQLVDNPDALPTGWGERVIGAAPEPGKSLRLTLKHIATILQQYPDMSAVTLRGALRLDVMRVGVVLDQARLRETTESYLAQNSDWKDCIIQTELVRPADPIYVTSTNVSIQIDGFDYDARYAAHLFNYKLQNERGDIQRIQVPVRVKVKLQVWVASRHIKQGAAIGPDDVRAEWVLTDIRGGRHVPIVEPVIGCEVERSILAGEAVPKLQLRQPVCVEKGAQVEILARRSGLSVRMRATALNRGRRGDRVVCLNETSKRQVVAILTGPGSADLVGLQLASNKSSGGL